MWCSHRLDRNQMERFAEKYDEIGHRMSVADKHGSFMQSAQPTPDEPVAELRNM